MGAAGLVNKNNIGTCKKMKNVYPTHWIYLEKNICLTPESTYVLFTHNHIGYIAHNQYGYVQSS